MENWIVELYVTSNFSYTNSMELMTQVSLIFKGKERFLLHMSMYSS